MPLQSPRSLLAFVGFPAGGCVLGVFRTSRWFWFALFRYSLNDSGACVVNLSVRLSPVNVCALKSEDLS